MLRRAATTALRRRRALSTRATPAADADIFRILAPTAILGYGFPRASFDAAAADTARPLDLIACDAGSVDPGPYYLATRSSFTADDAVRRDLRFMLEGALAQPGGLRACKVVVGTAGGCGTDNQVDALADAVARLLAELGALGATRVATVKSELHTPGALAGRALRALGPMPDATADGGDDGVSGLRFGGDGGAVVAQMGLEPVMAALAHADVVVCGRAYDPAVFAAEPIRRGWPAAASLHAAKVLECGAIAAAPGSGSDCLVAEITRGGGGAGGGGGTAAVWAPGTGREATPLSVAAHTLYEKPHPHCFLLPGGMLDTGATTFTERATGAADASSPRVVEIRGSRFVRTAPTVKLEGARVRGARRVCAALVAPSTRAVPRALVPDGGAAFVYGVDGVEARPVDAGAGEQELGLLVHVSGGAPADNAAFLALLRATLLHWGYDGRKSTAGNVAFPFSPSDLTVEDTVGEGTGGDGACVALCGTRDPEFIRRWTHVIEDVERRARALVPAGSVAASLDVRWVAAGLPLMPRLAVIESVAPTRGEADAALPSCWDFAAVTEEWRCDGGEAADFNCHHLVDVDDALTNELFSVRVVGGGEPPRDVPVEMVPWGCDDDGGDGGGALPSPEEVYAARAERSAVPAAAADGGGGADASGVDLGEHVYLGDIAKVVRSKNSGVNELTFDVIFEDDADYAAARGSAALRPARLETALGRRVVGVYCDDQSLAIKVTCDRGSCAGAPGERDVYGAQQGRALLDVVL